MNSRARLPQAQRVLHVDETRVLPQLPVHAVGHPSLSVVGVHHFPKRESEEGRGVFNLAAKAKHHWGHRRKYVYAKEKIKNHIILHTSSYLGCEER